MRLAKVDAQTIAFTDKIEQTKKDLTNGRLLADSLVDESEVRQALNEVMRKYTAIAERFGNFTKGAMGLLYPDKKIQREGAKLRLFTVFVKTPAARARSKTSKASSKTWAEVTFRVRIEPSGAVWWQ